MHFKTSSSSTSGIGSLAFFLSLLTLATLLCTTIASTIPITDNHNQKRAPKRLPTLEEFRKAVRVPKDKALFWSQTKDAKNKLVAKTGLTTDSTAYPPGFTDIPPGTSEAAAQKAADDWSLAYAEAAAGKVYILVPWDKGADPTRVFAKVEYQALLKNKKVTEMIQVNPDNFKMTRPYNPKIKSHLKIRQIMERPNAHTVRRDVGTKSRNEG
jgi:hypothetical protein